MLWGLWIELIAPLHVQQYGVLAMRFEQLDSGQGCHDLDV